MKSNLIISIILFLSIGNRLEAQTYVDPAATGANNGSSWTDAFNNLQNAINASNQGDTLWLMAGTYTPDRDSSGNSTPTNPREAAFVIRNLALTIYGGFSGSESSPADRDLLNNESVLDGDIGVQGDSLDNCYTLLYTSGTVYLTLDGLSFTNANGIGAPGSYKGALNSSNPSYIRNCKFYQNTSKRGGGIANFNRVLFIEDCIFYHNVTNEQGGAIYSEYAINILRSRFHDNVSPYGGAIKFQFTSGGRYQVSDCIIHNNTTTIGGGGAVQVYSADVDIFNSTIFNNWAQSNQGHAFSIYDASSFRVYNSIVWNSNTAADATYIDSGNDVYEFHNCIVSNSVAGPNNIFQKPLFSDSLWSFRSLACSPSVNTGDSANYVTPSNIDFYGNQRIQGDNIDIGAIEYQKFEIELNGSTLNFPEGGADSYQWFDCDISQNISGANSQSYQTTVNGNFALIYTYGSCTDTSDCINVNFNKLSGILTSKVTIYPNPSKERMIHFSMQNIDYSDVIIKIYDLQAKSIREYKFNNQAEIVLNLDDFENGIYIVSIDNKDVITKQKLILE